jgi:hypothetical protein
MDREIVEARVMQTLHLLQLMARTPRTPAVYPLISSGIERRPVYHSMRDDQQATRLAKIETVCLSVVRVGKRFIIPR